MSLDTDMIKPCSLISIVYTSHNHINVCSKNYVADFSALDSKFLQSWKVSIVQKFLKQSNYVKL